jgi:hypothetical protein
MDGNNDRMDALWVVDAETGEQLLLDVKTGQVIAKKDRAGEIIPG